MPGSKKNIAKTPTESIAGLKRETVKKNPVQKGYNEKNPPQPQGAFKPDGIKK